MQRAQTLDDYKTMARASGIAERIATAAVRSAVSKARATWPHLLDALPAPAAMKATVLERIATLPLARV
jgi:serine/threonine-protein kinase HipA